MERMGQVMSFGGGGGGGGGVGRRAKKPCTSLQPLSQTNGNR